MDETTSNIAQAVEEATRPVPEPEAAGMGEAPPESAEMEAPAEGTSTMPYELALPADLPTSELTDDRQALLGDFGRVAAASGIPRGLAQHLVDAFIDAEGAHDYRTDYSADEAERDLRAFWGSHYEERMKAVRQAVGSLGSRFRAWLDESNAGNHPPVLVALSMVGDMKLSKQAAQVELARIMAEQKGDYYSLDKWRRAPAVARVGVLSRIANADAGSEVQQARAALRQQLSSPGQPAPQQPAKPPAPQRQQHSLDRFRVKGGSAAPEAGTPRDEIKKMLADRDHPLNDRGHRDHAGAVRRYHDLLARL